MFALLIFHPISHWFIFTLTSFWCCYCSSCCCRRFICCGPTRDVVWLLSALRPPRRPFPVVAVPWWWRHFRPRRRSRRDTIRRSHRRSRRRCSLRTRLRRLRRCCRRRNRRPKSIRSKLMHFYVERLKQNL